MRAIRGRRIENTFDGQVVGYELSQATVDQMTEVQAAIYEALRPAEAETERLRQADIAKRRENPPSADT